MRPSSSPSEAGAAGGGGARSGLFGPILARGGAAGAVGDASWVRALLDVEAALAAVTAPPEAAAAIEAACASLDLDPGVLGQAAAAHASPVHPLVEAIRVAVGPPHDEFVHRGATTQDIMDTASMLVARRALAPILDDLTAAADVAARWADEHRDAPMMGRTLLQQAVPMTFGLKAAGWLSGLDAALVRLHAARSTVAVQLGGAAGTLAGLPANPVRDFAERLGLAVPDLPWHAERSRIADLAAALGIAAGAAGKIARDVTLLAQTEVAEIAEAAPGGSTAMAHKRNPVAAISVLAAATQAPGLVATLLAAMIAEHERAAGAWHAEWRPLRELLICTGSAAAWLRACLSGLTIDTAAMLAAVDRAGWPAENGADPQAPLGHAGAFVDAALARHAALALPVPAERRSEG